MEFKYKENGEMGIFSIVAGALPLAIPVMILSAIGWSWHSLSNFSFFLFISIPLIGLGIYSLTMKKRNYLVIRRDMLYMRNVFRMKKISLRYLEGCRRIEDRLILFLSDNREEVLYLGNLKIREADMVEDHVKKLIAIKNG